MGKSKVASWKEQSKSNGIFEMQLYSDGTLDVIHNGELIHCFDAPVWLWDSITTLLSKGEGMRHLSPWGKRRRKNEAIILVGSRHMEYGLEGADGKDQ